MQKRLTVLLCGLMLALVGNVAATLFDYDFNAMGFADGQDLEGLVLDYATLTSETGLLAYETGYGGGIHAWSYPGAGVVQGSADYYFGFSAAVSDLMFTCGDGGGDIDRFSVSLYEFGTDDFLGTWISPYFDGGSGEHYSLEIEIANVGRAIIDPGNSGDLPGNIPGSGGVMVSQFSYNAEVGPTVPEPASLILVGLGLAGLGIRRRFHK